MNLTTNEQAAALVLLQACLDGMCGKEPADLEHDEYIWCSADTLVADGWTAAEAAGTYGALIEKGIVSQYEDDADILSGWREIATLWPEWVEAGKIAEAIRGKIAAQEEAVDQEAAFVAALLKAGADEQVAKDMGVPFPGIICATLRSFASRWEGTRATFIKTAQLAGFNRFTAQTQWQRAKHEIAAAAVMAALGG